MPHIAVSKHNPFGLTLKQQLFVVYLVTDITTGKPIRPKESIKMVYSVKNDTTARVMASENLSKPNIKHALRHELKKRGLLGNDSKIVQILGNGLEAVNSKGEADHAIRLSYIQEIFKIIGLYDYSINNKVESEPYVRWDEAVIKDRIAGLQEELHV